MSRAEVDDELLDETPEDDTPENGDMRSSTGVFVGWIVMLALFALLYAYTTWTAVQNVITVPPLITRNYDFYRANGLDGLIKPVPWTPLVIAVVSPVVGFVAGILLGRGRSLWRRALWLLVVFAAVSAVAASVSASISGAFGL
ncbi:hypothetical protein AS850_09705 [Frondihabitans sp. 762G35]|uniref:hypothetical protein n=1 Tax=Frondihabitans sp. 762G35 TaxID=1446794 RepID=UPI000D216216|nr:hypothetical protein [Frondihabitans sp. 762G35]ARC57349.1 hypothetical protein AS850_09705 [Frondihabitans sp. 762G35]